MDTLVFIILLLPLAPAIILLFHKQLKRDLQLLVIICLLAFIQEILTRFTTPEPSHPYFLRHLIAVLEWAILILLFRTCYNERTNQIMNILLVAFLATFLTWLSLRGWDQHGNLAEILLSTTLIFFIGGSLPRLVRSSQLHILQTPLFWIASGTLFYLFITLLIDSLSAGIPSQVPGLLFTENSAFHWMAALVRYLLYIIAALVHVQTPSNKP